ncbi:MAG: hypothetical protein HW407_702 [Bacteroidetes bacterium]|nr:hypothetical protein [Bacteroidota bacterium]
MKTTFIILSALLLMLSTMGSSCINDPFLIAINVDPLTGCYGINSGNGVINDQIIVDLADLIDGSYVEKVKDARLYDIRVHVTGAYPGGSVAGQAFINDSLLFNFSGTWADFSTPQSLLGRSPHITPQVAGIAELVRVLKARPLGLVTLRATGQATPSPYPSGTQFCVEVYAQADAEI